MTLTLKISPEEETRLLAAAARRGQDVSDYLLTLARQEFSAKLPFPRNMRKCPWLEHSRSISA